MKFRCLSVNYLGSSDCSLSHTIDDSETFAKNKNIIYWTTHIKMLTGTFIGRFCKSDYGTNHTDVCDWAIGNKQYIEEQQ